MGAPSGLQKWVAGRSLDEFPPCPPGSLEPSDQNRGAGVVWVPPSTSRLEVCGYVEDLVAIRCGGASGNNCWLSRLSGDEFVRVLSFGLPLLSDKDCYFILVISFACVLPIA